MEVKASGSDRRRQREVANTPAADGSVMAFEAIIEDDHEARQAVTAVTELS